MKKAVLTVLMLGGAFLCMPSDASAQAARYYAWCAYYSGSDTGGTNCYFRTRAQCMATISGIGGTCGPNPFYDQGEYREQPRHHRRDRRDRY